MSDFLRADPDSYTIENADAIASNYSYALNADFLHALEGVIVMAHQAQVPAMIGLVAEQMFMTHLPQLIKIPSKFTPPEPKPGTIYAPKPIQSKKRFNIFTFGK